MCVCMQTAIMELKNKHIADMTSQMTAHKANIDMIKREAGDTLASELERLRNLNLQDKVWIFTYLLSYLFVTSLLFLILISYSFVLVLPFFSSL